MMKTLSLAPTLLTNVRKLYSGSGAIIGKSTVPKNVKVDRNDFCPCGKTRSDFIAGSLEFMPTSRVANVFGDAITVLSFKSERE